MHRKLDDLSRAKVAYKIEQGLTLELSLLLPKATKGRLALISSISAKKKKTLSSCSK